MALALEHREYIRALVRHARVLGAYFSVSFFVDGSDQEILILEALHTIQINIQNHGALPERYQALTLCCSSRAMLSFKKKKEES